MGESAAFEIEALDALPAGAKIGGYAVRRVIGHGGFGITYEAHNRVTGKEVAIKEFFPSSMARRDGQSRLIYSKVNAETVGWALRKFEETTTTLCGLSHPNIVQVHDYVPENDTGYMIMELLDGQTMKAWLVSRSSPQSLAALRPLVDPVMEALIYVHGRGLVHRDIAPDNILITKQGRPVLIDFGSVSRDLSDARHQDVSGTVGLSKRYYTAPEQMRAKARPTPEADIYSMGAVLYRALTGGEPVDGQERIDAFLRGEPDPYRPLLQMSLRDCPKRAAQAIDQALASRPEARLRTIATLRDELTAPLPEERQGSSRNVLKASAITVLVSLPVGVLAGFWLGEKAAAPAGADAMFDLGYYHDVGQSVTQDYAKAREWYEKAAARGNISAMRNLGLLFENGQGVTPNYLTAREWYEKAAARGNIDSMVDIGRLYNNGRGVALNYVTAREWYDKAAALGNGYAMNNLGILYEYGLGVTTDAAAARDWYGKGAAAGNPEAKKALQRLASKSPR